MNVFIKRAGFLALSAPHHEIAPDKRDYRKVALMAAGTAFRGLFAAFTGFPPLLVRIKTYGLISACSRESSLVFLDLTESRYRAFWYIRSLCPKTSAPRRAEVPHSTHPQFAMFVCPKSDESVEKSGEWEKTVLAGRDLSAFSCSLN
jgi:hypothetical protein